MKQETDSRDEVVHFRADELFNFSEVRECENCGPLKMMRLDLRRRITPKLQAKWVILRILTSCRQTSFTGSDAKDRECKIGHSVYICPAKSGPSKMN